MMKLRNTIFISSMVILLSACSDNDEVTTPAPPVRHAISLSTVAIGMSRAANVAVDLQDAQFVSGSTISVQVTDNAATSPEIYSPCTYTADGVGGLTTTNAQFYPISGSTIDLYAFHPADAGETFTVQSDQSTPENYRASDLMHATATGLSYSETPHELTFYHLLSKVVVKLEPGTGFTVADLDGATVVLGTAAEGEGLNNQVTFNAATGTISGATGDQAITVTTDADNAEHAAVIVPQNIKGKKLFVTLSGVTKSWTITSDAETFPLEAGKVYVFTITVNRSGLSVSVTIQPWATGENATGDITF